ncbi:hypothetical protein [Pengzhenrongella sicca]|uniref:Uncharacterized protein n=1 Tax=Pengzhenrongella sicca TaxID=2819238 RepID=A0A8A4ZAL5_9MICO|nr:hypothetical protein [Pengzhenrongella sicca]QTE27933.1 hypothetical protein J4E96_10990 [Pengzhenrongella sicca]
MGEVVALPLRRASVLPDVRGDRRALQVTWHAQDDVFVISLWRAGECTGSVRLAAADAAILVGALADGLAERG